MLLRHYLLGKRIGVCDNDKPLFAVAIYKAAHHLGAQYAVGIVLLAIFHCTAERRREEQDIAVAAHLHHVVVEIAGLLGIVHHNEQCLPGSLLL